MFADQTVELLPARTTMKLVIVGNGGRGGNGGNTIVTRGGTIVATRGGVVAAGNGGDGGNGIVVALGFGD